MITWPMISKFVVGIHPISFIVKIFKSHHSVVHFPGAILEDFIGLSVD